MWKQGSVLRVKKLHDDAIIPSYAHEGDSGLDLYTVEDISIGAGCTGIAKTGISIELPPYTEFQVRNRSGITVKGCDCKVWRIVLNNENKITTDEIVEKSPVSVKLGTVDNPYRGEIGIMVTNDGKSSIVIPKHTKLAQGVVCPIILVDVEVVDELGDTSRGENGYGSSDI